MPTDLLLPAFALTLVLNAAIVALAIRSLRTERGPSGAASNVARDRAQERSAFRPGHEPGSGRRPDAMASPTVQRADPEPLRVESDVGAEPEPRPEPVAAERAPDPEPVSAAVSSTTGPGGAARPGRRRKFSLPPAEDHDKVSRSIQTFLAGTDVAPSPPVEDAAPVVAPAPVVTVAAIQLVGGGGRALLERTVHSTARSTDVVSVDRRGRVRVVLTGTGELAAHAYLRRIRTIVEPVLESEDPPSRVVIATATELDGSVETARRRADRRLATALRAAAAETGRALDPASAGDEPDDDEAHLGPARAAGD